jgi:hypothetical protein
MAVQTAPGYIGKTGFQHPVELDRNILRSLSGARTGLARWGDLACTPTGVSGQLAVGRGGAFLLGAESALQGSYYAFSEATQNVSFAAAGSASTQRIDALLLRVADDQYGTIPVGAPQAYLDIVQGVPATSPVARPDSDFNTGGAFYVRGAWFRVADIRRDFGDTTIPGGKVTPNLRSARTGGYVICKSTDRPSDGVYGDRIIEYDTGRKFWWNGTVWVFEPGQLLYAKFQNDNGYLVQALTGFQTAFTSPAITVEANQTVYVNVRMPFICVPTAGNDIDGIIAIQENAGGYVDKHKIGVSKMPLANNYYPLTSRFPYKVGGSATTINVRLTAWSSNLYDVRCDPLYSFHLFVETTGKMNSEWV